MYGKPDCCLCDEAKLVAQRLATACGLEMQSVSILEDADLFARYRYRIPIVTWQGRELDEGWVEEARLRSALEAALAGQAGEGRSRDEP